MIRYSLRLEVETATLSSVVSQLSECETTENVQDRRGEMPFSDILNDEIFLLAYWKTIIMK
jgi:hypothetical protein